MAIRSRLLPMASLFVLALAASCQTYTTERVYDNQPARGFPFVFAKPYVATVVYDQEGTQVTRLHLARIPTLYATDVERAGLGVTKTDFETRDDHFLAKSSAELDQRIPENIGAITELLKTLGIQVAGAVPPPGAPISEFDPPLEDLPIVAMSFQPID